MQILISIRQNSLLRCKYKLVFGNFSANHGHGTEGHRSDRRISIIQAHSGAARAPARGQPRDAGLCSFAETPTLRYHVRYQCEVHYHVEFGTTWGRFLYQGDMGGTGTFGLEPLGLLVFQPSPNPCFPVMAALRKSAAESSSADCSSTSPFHKY